MLLMFQEERTQMLMFRILWGLQCLILQRNEVFKLEVTHYVGTLSSCLYRLTLPCLLQTADQPITWPHLCVQAGPRQHTVDATVAQITRLLADKGRKHRRNLEDSGPQQQKTPRPQPPGRNKYCRKSEDVGNCFLSLASVANRYQRWSSINSSRLYCQICSTYSTCRIDEISVFRPTMQQETTK